VEVEVEVAVSSDSDVDVEIDIESEFEFGFDSSPSTAVRISTCFWNSASLVRSVMRAIPFARLVCDKLDGGTVGTY